MSSTLIDTATKARRVVVVDGAGSDVFPDPVTRSILTTALSAGADRSVPAGRRSVTLVVFSGTTVTLDGATVQPGTYTYAADGNNTLPAIQINTTAPDLAMVMEMF